MDFRRLRPWLLAVSLAANGFMAGVLLADRPFFPLKPPRGDALIDQMAAVLSDADARVLRQAAADQGVLGDDHEVFEDFHRRGTALMKQENFDAQAFSQLVEDFAAKRKRNGDLIGRMLVQALPQMSLEGRRALADLRPPPGPPGPPPGPKPERR